MQMSYARISLVTLLTLSTLAHADDSSPNPESKLIEIRKSCVAQKKAKPMCACVAKVLRAKFGSRQLSDQQLSDAVTVMKNTKPGADDVNRLDYMADLITGLEYHCLENSNYSGE